MPLALSSDVEAGVYTHDTRKSKRDAGTLQAPPVGGLFTV